MTDKIGETKMLSWIKKVVALDLKHELGILGQRKFLGGLGRGEKKVLVCSEYVGRHLVTMTLGKLLLDSNFSSIFFSIMFQV